MEPKQTQRTANNASQKRQERGMMESSSPDPFLCLPELPVCGCQESELSPETAGVFAYTPAVGKSIVEDETSKVKGDKSETVDKKSSLLESNTFREDVRAEWIRAVFGTDFPQRKTNGKAAATETNKNNSWKGVGLAGISSYIAYSADLTLPENSTSVPSVGNATSQHGDDHDSDRATLKTPATESQQPSLGMTLSRLSLGLYVRKVHPGSEAWCAGVEENSVLVGINDGELNLLAEPSKSALERIWQYEGYCCDSTNNTFAKKNSSNFGAPKPKSSTEMKIKNPISMTFIREGRLYKVLFLGDPPYGIDWAPCGKFCLIQRVKTGSIADHAGVRPSSLVAGIYADGIDQLQEMSENGVPIKNTIYYLDHSSVAKTLKEATTPSVKQSDTKRNTIRLQLCFPPSESRSGHWERQQDALEEQRKSGGNNNSSQNSEKPNGKPKKDQVRPKVAAELDGIQVRIHPLLSRAGSMSNILRPSETSYKRSHSPNRRRNSQRPNSGCIVQPSSALAKLAERVAAGEELSISRNSDDCNPQYWSNLSSTGEEYGRFYRPCPVLKNSSSTSESNINPLQSGSKRDLTKSSSSSISILDFWNVEQALIYVFKHHLAGYNEAQTRIRATEDTAFHKVLSDYLQSSHSNGRNSKSAESSSMSDVLSTFLLFWFGWLTTQDNEPLQLTEYILKIVHQNQIRRSGDHTYNSPCDSLAHHMEFLAAAFDNIDVKKSLQKLRKQRQLSKSSGNSRSLIRAVTGTSPTNHKTSEMMELSSESFDTSASVDSEPQSQNRRFRLFRKKKKKPSSDKTGSFKSSKVTSGAKNTKQESSFDEKAPESFVDKGITLPSSNGKSKTSEAKSGDALFGNALWFLGELELVCADIEKSLMRSFSEKFARWALQPWTANKESALTEVTRTMRERLEGCNQSASTMPLLDPIDSCRGPMSSVDVNECYILPSAHFPLLLTFDCERKTGSRRHGHRKGNKNPQILNKSTRMILYGDEQIYRTTVELVALKGSKISKNNEKLLSRGFTVHGSVSGTVVESQQSIEVDDESNKHVWNNANFMVFDSRSSWGPPQTLSLRLSEDTIQLADKEEMNLNDSHVSRVLTKKECGYSWIELSPYWDEAVDNRESNDRKKDARKSNARKFSVRTKVVPFDAFNSFNEHGDLEETKSVNDEEEYEIEVQITTKILEMKSTVKRSLLYKHDDDVRQEMFAIEFIKACDRILRSCGLDMKLLVYGCISVGKGRGFVEWVHGSSQLSDICQPFAGSILAKNKDKKEKVKPITIEGTLSSDSIEGECGDDDDDNVTLSSVSKAGVTKYESLNRIGKDIKISPKKSNVGQKYVLPKNNNPIQDFLRSLAYDPNGLYNIKREVMDTYIKSCAGYSVCTYILGVGDRHLDNLLLHESGHFFHCDYSFLFGKDPKKYLPMRITQDMINGMGGWKSDNFCQFLSLACAAFLTLRRHENVRHLLSLIRLLEGCGLPDLETTQDIETAIHGVRERLKLDLSDEDAIIFMEKLIQDSCSSKMWIAVDAIHSLAQKF